MTQSPMEICSVALCSDRNWLKVCLVVFCIRRVFVALMKFYLRVIFSWSIIKITPRLYCSLCFSRFANGHKLSFNFSIVNPLPSSPELFPSHPFRFFRSQSTLKKEGLRTKQKIRIKERNEVIRAWALRIWNHGISAIIL